MITLRPAPLSTNNIYKIASKPFPRVYMSKEGKELKESYQGQIKAFWGHGIISGTVALYIKVYYGDKRKHDIDNGNKLLFDSLTGIVFKDDSQIEQLGITKYYDKEDPRVEIEVLDL